jgi:hypothetical protein
MTAYTRAMLRTFEREAFARDLLSQAVDLIVRLTPASKRAKAQALVEGFRKKIASDPDGLIQLRMFSTLIQLLESTNSPRKKQFGRLSDLWAIGRTAPRGRPKFESPYYGHEFLPDFEAEKERQRAEGMPTKSNEQVCVRWAARLIRHPYEDMAGPQGLSGQQAAEIRALARVRGAEWAKYIRSLRSRIRKQNSRQRRMSVTNPEK